MGLAWQNICLLFLITLLFIKLLLFSLIVEPMENWLQLMLNWDPQQRGGGFDPETSRPKCFVVMDHILNLKVSVVLLGLLKAEDRNCIQWSKAIILASSNLGIMRNVFVDTGKYICSMSSTYLKVKYHQLY